MKKFVFELEDVLKFREFEQNQAELELAKALNNEREIQQKIDILASQMVDSKKKIKNSKGFDEILVCNNFINFVKEKTEYFLEELSKLKLITEEKKKKLQICMQKTDALKNLKDEQFSAYKKEMYKIEDENIDDIVTSRFNI